jgi:hypothetical protein
MLNAGGWIWQIEKSGKCIAPPAIGALAAQKMLQERLSRQLCRRWSGIIDGNGENHTVTVS